MTPSRDERIVLALDRLTDRLRAGQAPQLEEVLSEQPDIAAEVRELWGAALLAENLGLPAPTRSSNNQLRCSPLPVDRFTGSRFGSYEILEEIGRGGMGVVYRARQRPLDRLCAVKLLLHADLSTADPLRRFQSEAEAAARLEHPHIVGVYEVGMENGQPFFSMPLIQGTTLAQRIASGPLRDRDAASLLIPVCRAVAYANRNGILHRDLKPSNILLDESGQPFVSDFGLAKRVNVGAAGGGQHPSLTQTGAILGTPGYMPPEQAAGRRGEVTAASDVYSLGAILYACLTGRPPFQAATAVDVLLLVLEAEPPPPRLLNPRIDADLEMIVLKALQKPADLRYASADDLADDLQAWLNNEPVSARSSRFTQVLSRAFRPTHHIGVLENWGKLWMLHAVVVLLLCVFTDALKWQGVTERWPFLLIWTFGFGAWALTFWNLRRRAGPVTFVERQIAHVWAASMACSTALFGVEYLLRLPVLTLSPVLATFAGAVFVAKAGILSGEFYLHAAVMFLASIPMALWPQYALTIFGLTSGAAFFFTGWKYDRLQKRTSERAA